VCVPARARVQAFFVAALLEENMKLRLARRAVHFESALSADAVLLHALAASTAFATLENVFYLNGPGGVGLITVFVRCVVGVPCHAAEGVISAAGLVMHRLSPSGRDGTISWRAAARILWPSVMLHGIWDAFAFLTTSFEDMLRDRCRQVEGIALDDWETMQADYLPMSPTEEADVDNCISADASAAKLSHAWDVLSLCSLIAFILLPCITVVVARLRMRKMRVVEQEAVAVHMIDGEGNHRPPPPEELYTAPAAVPEQLSVPLLDNIDNL
jgi:hypothetical protein